MEQPMRDFFINNLPSNITEDDVRTALRPYNIGVRSCRINERNHDHTRFAFLSVYNEEEYSQLMTLRAVAVKGHMISIRVSQERNADDDDKQYKSKLSVLLGKASDLGIRMEVILTASDNTRYLGNDVTSPSCVTFHDVCTDFEQVRISNSLKVDPRTNTACDTFEVQKDPLTEAKFDDIMQPEVSLNDITSHYSSPGSVSSNLPQTFSSDPVPHDPDPSPSSAGSSSENSMLRSLHLDRTARQRHGSANNSRGSLNDLSGSDTSTEQFFTPPDTDRQMSFDKAFSFKPLSTPSTSENTDKVHSASTPFIFGNRDTSPNSARSLTTSIPKNEDVSSKRHPVNKMNKVEPSRELNETPQSLGAINDVETPQVFNKTPLSIGVINTPQTFPPVSSLILKPIVETVTPDIPYDFRYLTDPVKLNAWFDSGIPPPSDEQSDSLSPMSTEDTFDMVPVTETWERTTDFSEFQLSDEIGTLNLEQRRLKKNSLEDQFNRDRPEVNRNSPVDNTDPATEDNLTGILQLLALFKSEIEMMYTTNNYEEFEGISLQVSHIFQDLVENNHISSCDIDNKDTQLLREVIGETEGKISDIQDLISTLVADDDADLVEDLQNDNLSVANEELREQKADLIILQMVNIIEHERALTNVSNPVFTS